MSDTLANGLEIFPDDQVEPGVEGYKEMHVEETLAVMRNISQRAAPRPWRYLRVDAEVREEQKLTNDAEVECYVRGFFDLSDDAPVVHRGVEWAGWAGKNPPGEDDRAFDPQEDVVAEGKEKEEKVELPKPIQELAKELGGKPAAPPRSRYWHFTSERSAEELRREYPGAPIEEHPTGGILAVWVGGGAPTSLPFPPGSYPAGARTAAPASAAHNPVDHPKHYTSSPSGVECIDVVEHLSFNIGNAIKYLWRAGQKGPVDEDLAKAAWYVERERARLRKLEGK
jgi:hypothetical protein